MKRILVGLDGSPRAPIVLKAAVTLAQKSGAKLVLMRAIGIPAEIPHDFWKEPVDSLQELLRAHAKEYLVECARDVPPALVEGLHVFIGQPWDAVCHAAKELKADLIFIGSHGYRGIDKVIGTTAAKVVNHADRSVLVCRAPELFSP